MAATYIPKLLPLTVIVTDIILMINDNTRQRRGQHHHLTQEMSTRSVVGHKTKRRATGGIIIHAIIACVCGGWKCWLGCYINNNSINIHSQSFYGFIKIEK